MAEIRVRAEHGHNAATIMDADAQRTFLEKYNIGFEQWEIAALDRTKRPEDGGDADWILGTFSKEVERLKREKGYLVADVIALTPEMENLDTICKKFDREHLHSEDEVRFVVDGRGVFTIHNDDDEIVFDVEVHPGDLLIVPEGTWHWFTLCEDRTIKCIRLFKDTSGWTPEYRTS